MSSGRHAHCNFTVAVDCVVACVAVPLDPPVAGADEVGVGEGVADGVGEGDGDGEGDAVAVGVGVGVRAARVGAGDELARGHVRGRLLVYRCAAGVDFARHGEAGAVLVPSDGDVAGVDGPVAPGTAPPVPW